MQRYDVVPYKRFTTHNFPLKCPISFLLACGNGSGKRVKLYEVENMKEPICEVNIENDGEKNFLRLTYLEEGYGRLREILLSHNFYGQYQYDKTRVFKFTLEAR